MSKTESAQFAIDNPPSCLQLFKFEAVERPGDIEEAARFKIRCKNCGGSTLRILCFPKVVEVSGEYAGLNAGDILERSPHRIECVECAERHLIFDATKHGYDGELGHGSSYEQGAGDEEPIQCDADSYGVDAIFTYNIELAELQEISSEDAIPAQDLFDWFHLIALSTDGRELRDIHYECA